MNKRCLAKRLMALLSCLALVLAPGLTGFAQSAFGLPTYQNGEVPNLADGDEPAPADEETPAQGPDGEDEGIATPEDETDEAADAPPAGDAEPSPEETADATEGIAGLSDATPDAQAQVFAAPVAAAEEADPALLATLYAAFEQQLGAAPLATIINETTIEVTSYAELITALGNGNSYTEIYFANSIAATNNQASVGSTKPNVTIYGRSYYDPDGENIFTLIQYPTSAVSTIILVNSSGTQSVTVKDMDVYGQSFYGVVGVENAYSGVIVRYENMTYNGPQMGYNRNGTVEFINCDIQIVAGRSSAAEEVVEAHNIVLGGAVTIDTTADSNGNSAFWTTNTVAGVQPSFTVLPGADVSITSSSYLFYSDQGDALRSLVTIGAGARFITESRTGVSRHFIDYVFEEGCTATFTQTAAADQGFRIRNFLVVEEGANLQYIRTNSSTNEGLFRTQSQDATVTFNNPGRVYLYNYNKRLHGSEDTARRAAYTFTTEAINIWSSASDSAAEPDHIWNKASGQPFVTTANYNGIYSFSINSGINPGSDPVDSDITDTDTFNLFSGSELLVFGQIRLEPDTITDLSTSIPGLANGYDVEDPQDAPAQLTGSYTGSNGAGALAGTAAEDGRFNLGLTAGAPQVGSTVELVTYYNSLRMRKRVPVENAADYTVYFLTVPATLAFQIGAIPLDEVTIGRQEPGWTIVVQDDRPVSTGFRVDASVSGPLRAGAYTLEDALVYVDSGNSRTPLSAQPLTVYTSTSGTRGTYPITWADAQGPLVHLQSGNVRANVSYTTTVQWDLVDAP